MRAVFLREIQSYFTSLTGWLVLTLFSLLTGLIVWVFPETSIPDYGYASLETFFRFTPLAFLFLIPAITMKSFSEEKKSGTIEFLLTHPVSLSRIIAGKYFSSLLVILCALLPTLIYFYSVWQLGAVPGNLDTGATIGSYVGLFLLAAAFAAIGVFSSSLTSSQVMSFVISAALCFLLYSGLESISQLPAVPSGILSQLGMKFHFAGLSRGVIDSRDVLYFLSLIVLFFLFTRVSLEYRR